MPRRVEIRDDEPTAGMDRCSLKRQFALPNYGLRQELCPVSRVRGKHTWVRFPRSRHTRHPHISALSRSLTVIKTISPLLVPVGNLRRKGRQTGREATYRVRLRALPRSGIISGIVLPPQLEPDKVYKEVFLNNG